jgi:hypothetical protein
MPTYRFDEVVYAVTKKVPCRACGKTLTRSTTLSQTVNPFNKNPDGTVKTEEQIWTELRAQAEAWSPSNDIHAACAALDAIEISAWGDSIGAGYRDARPADLPNPTCGARIPASTAKNLGEDPATMCARTANHAEPGHKDATGGVWWMDPNPMPTEVVK